MAGTTEVSYGVLSQQDWDKLPEKAVKPASQWEEVLQALQAGKIVQLTYTNKRDKLSKRISIARQASKLGFRTQMRYTDTHMAVRRVSEELEETPEVLDTQEVQEEPMQAPEPVTATSPAPAAVVTVPQRRRPGRPRRNPLVSTIGTVIPPQESLSE